MKAAIYVRVSSERQAGDDRVSIDAQLKDCRNLCEGRGYTVVQEYVDKENYRARGKLVSPSGTRKDRPAYVAMLKAARAGEIDVIVAWKTDRLYRGLYAAIPFMEALDERGAALNVELALETFDRKFLEIKAAMGKIELDNIRERMLMGRRARLERGELPGGDQVRYGYKRVDKHLEIEETEAYIVRKTFEMYIEGESIMGMRKRLDATGIAPRRAKRWPKSTVTNILRSDFYATGELTVNLDGEEYPIPCPPIISMETWHAAQEVKRRNKRYYKPRNVKEDYLCAGIVYCGCGYKMQAYTHASSREKDEGGLTGSYVCQRHKTKPETVTDDCVMSAGSTRVDNYVWDYVKRICHNPALVHEAMAQRLAKLETEQAGLESELERLERAVEELTMERQWVITQARKGAITEDDMEMQLGALQMQQWSHNKELAERRADMAARTQLKAAQEWADNYLTNLAAGMATMELDAQELSEEDREYLYQELEAWRFEDKFPDNKLEQLKWAQLEERRRVVRALIKRVDILPTGRSVLRDIQPVLALDIPMEAVEGLASGDQSLEYIEAWHKEKEKAAGVAT